MDAGALLPPLDHEAGPAARIGAAASRALVREVLDALGTPRSHGDGPARRRFVPVP